MRFRGANQGEKWISAFEEKSMDWKHLVAAAIGAVLTILGAKLNYDVKKDVCGGGVSQVIHSQKTVV